MKVRVLTMCLLLLIGIAGCQKKDDMNKKEIGKLASQVAAMYMKDEKNINFVPKHVEFLGGKDLSEVLVHGYAKDKGKEEGMSVMVDYGDDYRVTGYGHY